jgi:thioredoxin-dependent peroxiredoxin
MPEIGKPAPEIRLQNQEGEWVQLSDYKGKKVVLFIFPRANTMGCNAQACGFRDEFETISAANAVVLGLSADTPEVLKKWKADKKLPYDLLSDPDHKILEDWGVWHNSPLKLIGVRMVDRSYWVIDEQGIVIDGKAGIGPNESVRRALEAVNINVASV